MPLLLRHWFLLALLPLTVSAALETWTGLDGQKISAEFLGRKGEYVTFKTDAGDRVLYPYAKLTRADRTRIDAYTAGAETPVASVAPVSATAAAEPAPLTKIATALSGKLVTLQGNALQPLPADGLAGTKLYAVYFSAHWCPPCRGFTPDLVASYAQIKAAHPEFELIFVSNDENEKSMKKYMSTYRMAWTALRFDQIKPGHPLSAYEQNGIPNLVFIDGNGKILSKSYAENGSYLGPQKVLSDIRAHLKM